MSELVTDETVETAARAIDHAYNPERHPILAAMFGDYARAALEAAAPQIAAAALCEAADEIDLSPSYPTPGLSELHNANAAAEAFLRARADEMEVDRG